MTMFDFSVPSSDPSGLSVVLNGDRFRRIKSASHVKTKEQIAREYEITKQERQAAMV